MSSKLLIILNYRISDILEKGEYIAGYYNPADFFDEIHLLLTVEDRVNPEDLQFTVGRARLFLHNIPAPSFRKTLGWQFIFLKSWVNQCIELIREINPNIIRVHNSFIQGYLASEAKKKLGIPYIISLHSVFDRDCLESYIVRFMRIFSVKLERAGLKNADGVIAVYHPIVRYAKKLGAKNIHVIYNAVAGDNIRPKQNYNLSDPARLITINRQLPSKNPENILRAIKDIDCIYEIVGDGPIHERLRIVAQEAGVEGKVRFLRQIPNEQLTSHLHEYDLLVSHCDNWGISKSIIEGSLAGLPIIHNRHPVEPLPDLEGGWVNLVENSVEGYHEAIRNLLDDPSKREILGTKALEHALKNFDPHTMNAKIVALYQQFMLPCNPD